MNARDIRLQMISARDEYIEIIKSELLGPGSEFNIPDVEHELISSSPLSRYSMGILFPQGNLVEQDNDETVAIDENESIDLLECEDVLESDEETALQKPKSRIYEFDETANETLDEEIGMASQYKQSSMGITFIVKGDTDKIYCDVSFATYRSSLVTDCIVPYTPENSEDYTVPPELSHFMYYDKEMHAFRLLSKVSPKEIRDIFERDTIPETEFYMLKRVAYRLLDFLNMGYVRIPHHICNVEIDFSGSNYFDNEKASSLDDTPAKIVALRTKISDNVWSVTVMLVNELNAVPAKSHQCIFQSKIKVRNNNKYIFEDNNLNSDIDTLDSEEKSLELLYRHKKIYGTGLGTSVDWNVDSSGNGEIWTDFFPISEIPSMSFSLPENDNVSESELSMKYYSDLDNSPREKKLHSLCKLVDLYTEWIKELKRISETLAARYQSAALKNIDECLKAANRMYAGIDILKNNENAYNAFLLANRAMFMQRIHIQKQSDLSHENADRYPDDEEISDWLYNLDYAKESGSNCKWRPFQIAFLLMDINSIVDDHSDDRSLVDLIWFPTGGGKTEAYLGLTAFTIFYRKLAHPDISNGTAVMMRYTLRLLAAQQFTRAATLICACEYIRLDCQERKHKYPVYPLGKSPITIGLWIGGAHIPNNNTGSNSAQYHLEKLQNISNHSYVRSEKERHNKFQVLKCPWCGTKLVKDDKNGKLAGEWGYAMKGKHFYMFCPHEACDFTKRLPIQIIDE